MRKTDIEDEILSFQAPYKIKKTFLLESPKAENGRVSSKDAGMWRRTHY